MTPEEWTDEDIEAISNEAADDIKAVCNQMLLRKGELDREEGQCDHRPAAGLPVLGDPDGCSACELRGNPGCAP